MPDCDTSYDPLGEVLKYTLQSFFLLFSLFLHLKFIFAIREMHRKDRRLNSYYSLYLLECILVSSPNISGFRISHFPERSFNPLPHLPHQTPHLHHLPLSNPLRILSNSILYSKLPMDQWLPTDRQVHHSRLLINQPNDLCAFPIQILILVEKMAFLQCAFHFPDSTSGSLLCHCLKDHLGSIPRRTWNQLRANFSMGKWIKPLITDTLSLLL